MDKQSNGTDTQMHPNLASKPKPPPSSMKPKPSLPKKPAVASKPPSHVLEKSQSQNGPEPAVKKPSVPEKVARADQSSPTPQRSPRPKEPPPPLPKTAPKGPAVNKTPPTVHKTPPSVHKTPPPLPKTTPRVSVKHKESSLDTTVKLDETNKLNVEACSSDTQKDCDEIKTDLENRLQNDAEDFTFNNLKSKFASSNENISKVAPKIAVKPKPLLKGKSVKSTSVDTSSPASAASKKDGTDKAADKFSSKTAPEIKHGKSKWFIKGSPEKDTERTNTVETGANNSAVQFLVGNQGISESTVWFNKSEESPKQSPKHSPAVPRKPLPRPPPKPGLSHSMEDISNINKKDNFSSSSENSPVQSCEKSIDASEKKKNKFQKGLENDEKSVEDEISHSKLNDSAKAVIENSELKTGSETQTDKPRPQGSPKPLPKPVPRRTAPAVPVIRPRPTPRKRLSINRLSGTEETFESHAEDKNVENLSDNKKSSDNDKIVDLKDKTDVKVKEGDSKNKDSSNLQERTVISDTGEEQQYRVIDKSFARSRSHITELDHETVEDTVILRKKVPKEEEDSDEELTLEQLKSIEHLLEASDDDGEHKFLSKVDPAESGVNEKESVNKLEKGADKNRKGEEVSKGSFDDLDDKALLEPTSLLNEIEDILTRSFKHSSLTRSGSSPEKKSSPFLKAKGEGRAERSKSVDAQGSTPVRPPRPKKEQKKLRSMSQVMYDSCGSDTESLPDLTRGRDGSFNANSANVSLTLGKAKPHPPKPKRNKLLKVQRSQSDVTAMKSIVDKLDKSDSKSPRHRRMLSDSDNTKDVRSSSPGKTDGKTKQTSWRKNRPSRKAPPPPQIPPLKVTPASPGVTLDTVIPVDTRVKSVQLNRDVKNKKGIATNQKGHTMLQNTTGSFYHAINDDQIESSDGEHDYQDIPDDSVKNSHHVDSQKTKHGKFMNHQDRETSPPKLPPRNLNNSHSFDTSSLSSAGFDSVITGGASSTEDISISSGCFDHDVTSPGFKNTHIMKSLYPKTSSPCVKTRLHTGSDENMLNSGLDPSNSSQSDSTEEKKKRPVSGCSTQSDNWSGSHEAEQSSSDSELDDEEKITRKKEKKLLLIAQEIVSSENVFVDVLKLLNVDFRVHVSKATEKNGRPVIPNEMLNRILDYLPQLQIFNEGLLKDLEERLRTWEEHQGIADIFVKKGPFLKLFSSYIRDFETITATFDEAIKKYPLFQAAVKEFELSPRCASLALKHYMLKPIQRIPQYRLLLQDYMKHLLPDSPEMKDMQTALNIVSEVATHANENMRHEDYVQKMLEIQRSLIGQFEVIKPGRIFLKEGELMKLSRKEMQPRYFFLFNDVLLYTTPVATGYRLNNVLPLAGMKVSVAAQDEYKMEFSIISVQRSFTLHGATLEERDDWVTALNAAIEENALKRNTFEAVRAGAQFWEEHLQKSWDTYQALLDKDFVLGHKAPLWIPDARVTMCMLCTCEFTVTWRRHHCRACGWVVCGNCSDCKAPLRYLKYKAVRVCDKCYKTLMAAAEKDAAAGEKQDVVEKDEEDGGNFLTLNGLFERFQKIRRSGRTDKKTGVRPERLKEVSATDQGACMSGYLQRWHKGKKWKRHWYLIKDKVLFTFKATQDTAAAGSMVLLGYEVSRFTDFYEGVEPDLLFQLSHANTDPVVFRTDSATATEKWVTVMRESTVA